MLVEIDYDEMDVINALRNCKRNPHNKTLVNILLGVVEDILERE